MLRKPVSPVCLLLTREAGFTGQYWRGVTSQQFWRRYVRSHIISSDYEGCVTLWDVDTGAAVNEYEAHDKRIWSVDYCTTDPFLFVSGSDDGFIKVGALFAAAMHPACAWRALYAWLLHECQMLGVSPYSQICASHVHLLMMWSIYASSQKSGAS